MTNGKSNFLFGLFFGLITFLALNLSIYAQRVKITQEEFKAANSKAFEQLKEKPKRVVFKSIVHFERSTVSSENITEIVPHDKKRFLSKNTAEPKNSGVNFTMEIIEIGDRRFTRKDNGTWTETSISSKTENKTQIAKPQTENVIDYYFLGETVLNGQPADLYEMIVRDKLKSKLPAGENKEIQIVNKSKLWFGKNGLWIRDESEYEFSDAASDKVTHRQQVIRTYEYAPNLKIEAPKIN